MGKATLARVTTLLLSGLLVLAGCGSKAGTAGTAAVVKEKGEISFAMSGGYPPFNYFDGQTKQLTGFDVEVAQEVANHLGVKMKPVTTEWSGILEGLRAGRYDAILGSMAVTPKRQEVVDFSRPYYLDGAQLLVRADSTIQGPADLKGKVVALATGTTFEEDAKQIAGLKDIKLLPDDNATLDALKAGRVDAVITGFFVALDSAHKSPQQYKLVGEKLRTEEIAVAVRKGDAELLAAINKALDEMHKDGTYLKISQKWFQGDISQ